MMNGHLLARDMIHNKNFHLGGLTESDPGCTEIMGMSSVCAKREFDLLKAMIAILGDIWKVLAFVSVCKWGNFGEEKGTSESLLGFFMLDHS